MGVLTITVRIKRLLRSKSLKKTVGNNRKSPAFVGSIIIRDPVCWKLPGLPAQHISDGGRGGH